MTTNQKKIHFTTLGLMLLSLSILIYEIALTRILSVILSYHYVFLVVSSALLGLSLGAVFEYLFNRKKSQDHKNARSLTWWSAWVAISMSLASYIILISGNANSLLLLVVSALLPFFFAGVTLATLFKRFANNSARMYGADLIGAALGAVLVISLLNFFGAVNTNLGAALIAAFSTLAFMLAEQVTRSTVTTTVATFVLTLLVLIVSFINPTFNEVPITRDPDKDMYRALYNPSFGGKIIESRWSAFGRTDLVSYNNDKDSMALFIDGAAGTSMYRWNGQIDIKDGPVNTLKHSFPGAFPFLLLQEKQKDNAFIIGPGGGLDVVINLVSGIKHITAAEVNPEFVQIVRDYASFNGGIYTNFDNVKVVVEEGRNFLKRSSDSYDIIMLSLPVIKSSRNYESYALTENFLFTKESIQDYLDHLTDEGMVLVVAHNINESLRLLMTTLDALQERGTNYTDAMKQIYLLGNPMMPVFVLHKRALSEEQATIIHSALHAAGFDGETSYIPYIKQSLVNITMPGNLETSWQMMNQNLIDLAQGNIQPQQLVDASPADISPVSDDNPFFYKFEPGIPKMISSLFIGTLFLLIAVIIIPWLIQFKTEKNYKTSANKVPWTMIVVFSGLGTGFMLIEITLYQKLILFVGHPTYALSLLLFSLLIGTGLGSIFSGIVTNKNLTTGLWLSSAGVMVSVFIVLFVINNYFINVTPTYLNTSILPALLLMTLGIILGFPFPTSIRLLKLTGHEYDIPWLWAINGVASVLGSVLVIIIAMKSGYNSALITGALVYFVVALVAFFARYHLKFLNENEKLNSV